MPGLLFCWLYTFPTLFLELIYFSPALSKQYLNMHQPNRLLNVGLQQYVFI